MNVPFLDLQAINNSQAAELEAAFRRVLQSGWFVLGKEVEQFEQRFAAYCGSAHGIGVANGLDAIMLVLRAWGIGPGDEVIVPSNTPPGWPSASAAPRRSRSSRWKPPTTSIPPGSKLPSRPARRPSLPCTCTASLRICGRSWTSPRGTA